MSQWNQNSSTTVVSSYPAESQRRHTQLLMQFNQEMYKRNVLTDVECIVEGQVFQAHRTLLACFSPYLKRKLLSDDGKPLENKVYIPKIESKEFEILLQYMYSGNLEVNCKNIFEVYKAASLLEMQHAKEECLQLIDGTDEIKTYFYAYVLSKKLGVEANWQKALQLITHRFEETVFTKEFMQLDLKYVLEILSAQNIGARSEVIVFLAALNWLNEDYENRVDHAISVMECVRFSCMSIEEIVACFHPPFLPQVVQIREIQMMLFRATVYIAAKSQGKEDWFKHYAQPKRNLTVERLPMKLWHTESYAQVGSQREHYRTSSRYRAKSWFPDSLRNQIQAMQDSEEPESKYLAQSMETLFRKNGDYCPDKEKSTDPLQENHLITDHNFLGDLKGNEMDKKPKISEKISLSEQTKTDFFENLPEKMSSLPIVTKRKEALRKSLVKPKSTADEGQEIKYIIPDDIKVIHLVKGPLKSQDVYFDNKYVQSQDFGKMFPEKSKMYEEKSFRRKEAKKPLNLSVDPIPSTKYQSFQKSGKSEINKEVSSDGTIITDKTIDEKGCILIVGGMNPRDLKKDAGGYVRIFNVSSNKLMPFINLPEPRHNHCSACLENTLYVVGGCNSEETFTKKLYIATRSCFELNLDKARWSKIPDIICARFDHGLVVYKEYLVVIGGQDENQRLLKSIEMYDVRQKRWKMSNSSLCCGRRAMGVAVFADRIWVVGGIIQSPENNSSKIISHVDIYNPENKKWYFNSYSLPRPRSHCCVAEWNGKLYCIGGVVEDESESTGATSEVWFVESENQLWNQGPFLPEPRMGGALVTYGENLYYVGGYDPKNASNIFNIIFLTPEATSWCIGPPMTPDIFGLSAVSYRLIQEKHE